MLEFKLISLFYQNRARPTCISDKALYCWLANLQTIILIFFKTGNGQLQKIEFKKFSSLRVKHEIKTLTPVAGLITRFPLRYFTPFPSECKNTLKKIIGGNSPPPNLYQNKGLSMYINKNINKRCYNASNPGFQLINVTKGHNFS